jgi:hypothetical protein
MDRHLHTLTIPLGRVMYTHHEMDAISDGTDRLLSDGYLVAGDGSSPIPLRLDDLLQIIGAWGCGEMLRLAPQCKLRPGCWPPMPA